MVDALSCHMGTDLRSTVSLRTRCSRAKLMFKIYRGSAPEVRQTWNIRQASIGRRLRMGS